MWLWYLTWIASSVFCQVSGATTFHPTVKKWTASPPKGATEDKEYWTELGKAELLDALDVFESLNTNIAKNVILFIGDGMSLTTLSAARIYKAQYESRQDGGESTVNGEESLLALETFPHVGLVKTFNVNAQTSDSASTASAIFSGVKTNAMTLGFDNSVTYQLLESQVTATRVETVLKWAQDANKDTGFVTTARVSHATPAALYAHSADRNWECDRKMPDGGGDWRENATDITYQLVMDDPGRKIKVVLGGGAASWTSKDDAEVSHTRRKSHDDELWECDREDGLNLIDEFLRKNETVEGFAGKQGVFVKNRDDLLHLDLEKYDYLLGLFSESYMEYEDLRVEDNTEPSITEMTETAVKFLQKGTNGFFLMVEGSNIDHAHHGSRATQALHETMMLDNAVAKVLEMVDLNETLVLVTADHAHTLTSSGYQHRGADIRGLTDVKGQDDKPYMTLSYANGLGFYDSFHVVEGKVSRTDLGTVDYTSFGFQNPSSVPLESETHSAADVGIFAIGPYSHLFHSVHDQSYIAQVMAYSACIGPHKDDQHCTNSAAGRVAD